MDCLGLMENEGREGRKVSQGRKETEENLDPQEKIHNRPTMSSWRAPQVQLVLLVLQAPLALLDRLAHKDPRGPPETGVTGPIFPSTLPRPWILHMLYQTMGLCLPKRLGSYKRYH